MSRVPFQIRSAFLAPSFALFCCHFCAAQTPSSAQNSPQSETTKISGTIVNALDGSPLGNARVSVSDTRNRTNSVFVVTSDNGHFEFLGLKAGKYSLQGAKRGYLSAAYDQHEQFSTAIVTGTGIDTERLVLRLIPLAYLAGKVVDESGDPVRLAQVHLYRENRGAGLDRILQAGSSTTDDQGSYEFPLLSPGNYFVAVEAKPWYAVHPPTRAPDGKPNAVMVQPSLDVSYPTTYYNGATEAEMAVPIPVKAGDRVRIEVQLNPVPALHLFFRVPSQKQGFTVPSFQKRVFDAEQFIQPEGMQPVGEGLFEVTGIPAGKYVVRQNDPETGQLAAELDLSENGQTLEAAGEPAGKVKLAVRFPSGEQVPKQFFFALQDSRRHVVSRPVSPDGTAEFPDLASGKYSILPFSPNHSFSVARTVANGVERAGHDLNMTPGVSLDVTVFLSEGVTDIEGFAKRGASGAAGVMVVLVPKDPESHQELIRRDQSDLDGSFVFRGVIPGMYTIVAVENAWDTPWQKPDLLARYLKRGVNVSIAEMMRGAVQLKDPVQVQPR